jgi:hypothetical protein
VEDSGTGIAGGSGRLSSSSDSVILEEKRSVRAPPSTKWTRLMIPANTSEANTNARQGVLREAIGPRLNESSDCRMASVLTGINMTPGDSSPLLPMRLYRRGPAMRVAISSQFSHFTAA